MLSRLAAPFRRRFDARAAARRLAYFWVVWSALLFLHESGHAIAAGRAGVAVERVTVGVGPAVWRTRRGDTELVLRLVPVAGVTRLGTAHGDAGWARWRHEGVALAGGVVATLLLAAGISAVVAIGERTTRRRLTWGRMLLADALVLTVFNFLPVPPLDGGRALLAAVDAARGAPIPPHALFWVHVSGLALAVVPMALWTRWTARLDAAVMLWRAPETRG